MEDMHADLFNSQLNYTFHMLHHIVTFDLK